MRRKSLWWRKWQRFILGLHYVLTSFCLAQLTPSLINESFAEGKREGYNESYNIATKHGLWMQNSTEQAPLVERHKVLENSRTNGLKSMENSRTNGLKSKKYNRLLFPAEKHKKWKLHMGGKEIRHNFKQAINVELQGEMEVMKSEHRYFDQRNDNNSEVLSYSWAIKLPVNNFQIANESFLYRTADRIARDLGLRNYGPIGGLKGYFYFVHNNFFDEVESFSRNNDVKINITDFLKGHPEIEWVRHEPIRMRKKRTLEFKDQFFPSQWHLVNLKFVNHDINVTGVWEKNITGRGVVVAVIDDGVEWTNPDILDNYSSEGSWDLNSNDGDPMPRVDEAGLNHHGTRCAGEIAAVANEYCAVGVAYEARVSGIRILDGPMTDSLEAMAFNTKMNTNDVYSCSWGPDDNGKTVDGPHRLAQAALAHGVMAGRRGYGSIFVVASGNGGHFKDNCNFDGYANSIFTVTIGAVDELGQMPYYAEHCAAMLAVTYSSGQGHQRNIVTTDWRLGGGTGCTDRHTGTSAAAPLAAGIIALMLQVRNCLTWRDIQHIIVYTAVKVPIDEDEWHKNGAGFSHSHKHGFGLLNSWKLVTTAKMWESVPFMTSWSSPFLNVNAEIPATGQLIQDFKVAKDMVDDVSTLEHVTVTINVKHPCRGDVMIKIISPTGTVSKLATARKYDRSSEGFLDWTFSTVRYWGERPEGSWQIVVTDAAIQPKRGKLKHWKLTFYGSSMTPKEIQRRKRLVREVASGKYLSRAGPPCQPPPSPAAEKISFSGRLLKVLLLLSGFFFLVCTYFMLETICSNEGKFRTIDLNESDIQAADGFDIKNFLPKELAAQDQIRLNILLEGGTQKQSYKATPTSINSQAEDEFSHEEQNSKPASVSIVLTPDEISETKQVEERLKRALEQSRILQTQQMNQIKNLENEISNANKDEGLEMFDMMAEKTAKSKKPKKLKGILKKPKQ